MLAAGDGDSWKCFDESSLQSPPEKTSIRKNLSFEGTEREPKQSEQQKSTIQIKISIVQKEGERDENVNERKCNGKKSSIIIFLTFFSLIFV